jgi:hypothetical protein
MLISADGRENVEQLVVRPGFLSKE